MLPYFIRRNIVDPLRREVGSFLIESGMSILNIKDPTLPPKRLDYVGGFDFKAAGFEFLRYFIQYGGLQPDHTVLDIGSGIGRMAIPLTNYLKKGRYEGIEIVQTGVNWCQNNVTVRNPNFNFHHADIYNKLYNKTGTVKASEYRFPFDANTFDFIFLTSVFTHMLTDDVQHYVSEIARVLKPSGTVLSTWFLLTEESRECMKLNPGVFQLVVPVPDQEHLFTVNIQCPEDVTGFDQEFVELLFENNGIELKTPIHYGSWCGRSDYLSFQDIVIGSKK